MGAVMPDGIVYVVTISLRPESHNAKHIAASKAQTASKIVRRFFDFSAVFLCDFQIFIFLDESLFLPHGKSLTLRSEFARLYITLRADQRVGIYA